MFGYVKAYHPWLRVCELDLYKGVYCGLCKTITERSGFVPSLLLSYDIVFLTVAALGYDKSAVAAEKRRCPLHPIKRPPAFTVGRRARKTRLLSTPPTPP